MDEQTVLKLVRSLEPNSSNITIISHGRDNIIATIDDQRVYRFPRDQAAKSKLQYEAAILKKIDGKLSLHTPRLVREHLDPPYIVTSFIEGSHHLGAELRAMSPEHQQTLAEDYAVFALELNQAVTVDEIMALQKLYMPHVESIESLLKHNLRDATFPKQPWLEELAQRQFDAWQALIPVSPLPVTVIHNDLHSQNLMFVDNQIGGVLDFAECTVGTISQELRKLFHLGPEVIHQAASFYHLRTGIVVDESEIGMWAITLELSDFCQKLAGNQIDHPEYARTKVNLERWMPEFTQHSDLS